MEMATQPPNYSEAIKEQKKVLSAMRRRTATLEGVLLAISQALESASTIQARLWGDHLLLKEKFGLVSNPGSDKDHILEGIERVLRHVMSFLTPENQVPVRTSTSKPPGLGRA